MHIRIMSAGIAFGVLAGVLPAFAESVSVRASATSHMKNDDETHTEVRVMESNSDENGRVQRSESRECINGTCVMRTTDENGTTTVRTNLSEDNSWWTSWRTVILQNLHEGKANVLLVNNTDALRIAAADRMHARMARRVCVWFADEEREQCLKDATEGEGLSMRERLRSWIDLLQN